MDLESVALQCKLIELLDNIIIFMMQLYTML